MVTLQLKNDKWFTLTIVQFAFIDELSMIWLFNAIFNNIQLIVAAYFMGDKGNRSPQKKQRTSRK